jgi:molybdate transport system substrate-binding protein
MQASRTRTRWGRWSLCLVAACAALSSQAATVTVAVAANFTTPLNALIAAYYNAGLTYSHSSSFSVTSGATADLASAISTAVAAGNATPYDLFFSADDTTPAALYASYPSVVLAPYFYAQGKLVLWSKYGPNVSSSGYAGFPSPSSYSYGTGQVAIANPSTAPYGTAAQQVLSRLLGITYPGGAYDSKFSQYSTITATSNAVAASTGATSYPNMGFVAKSSICDPTTAAISTAYIGTFYEYTPASVSGNAPHDKILQDAVAIRGRSGASAAAVDEFSAYVQSAAGKAILANYCYLTTAD